MSEAEKVPTVNVKILPGNEGIGKLIAITLLSLAPVAIAVLMQNSALRQRIAMKLWQTGEISSGKIARQFGDVSAMCHHKYDLARL